MDGRLHVIILGSLLLGLPGAGGQQAGDSSFSGMGDDGPWPHYRGDAGHTGSFGSADGEPSPVAWSKELRQWVYTAPAPFEAPAGPTTGFVVGDEHGWLYAFELETGRKLWETRISSRGFDDTHAVVGPDTVYVGCDDAVCALDLDTGDVTWRTDLGSGVESAPTLEGGRVYVGTYTEGVVALDAGSGAKVWARDLPGFVRGAPTIVGERLYAAGLGGVHALDAGTGTRLWSTKCPGAYIGSSSPAVDAGQVYVASDAGVVCAFDGESGELIWTYRTGGAIQSSLIAKQGTVWATNEKGRTFALSSFEDHVSVLWEHRAEDDSRNRASIALEGNRLVVGHDSGLTVLDADTGEALDELTSRKGLTSPPTVINGILTFAIFDRVYALDLDGHEARASPTAVFAADVRNMTVTVDATGSEGGADGASVAFHWDWGDGSSDATRAPVTSHTYGRGGEYDIVLTVTDAEGGEATTRRVVTVAEAEPSAREGEGREPGPARSTDRETRQDSEEVHGDAAAPAGAPRRQRDPGETLGVEPSATDQRTSDGAPYSAPAVSPALLLALLAGVSALPQRHMGGRQPGSSGALFERGPASRRVNDR